MPRLIAVADDLLHATYAFKAGGIRISTRMTVVRLNSGDKSLTCDNGQARQG